MENATSTLARFAYEDLSRCCILSLRYGGGGEGLALTKMVKMGCVCVCIFVVCVSGYLVTIIKTCKYK